MHPLVSVVIPAYNAERWIEETIASARSQTYPQIEIIVVNDGSTDDTASILEAIGKDEPRLRTIHQQNSGLPAARNRGASVATGEYVAPLDADDLWKPDKLAKQVSCFANAVQVGRPLGLVYCWSNSIDEASRIIRPGIPRQIIEGRVFDALLMNNFVGNGSCPMFPREIFLSVGAYPEAMTIGCEDWALYLRIAEEYEYGVVPEFLCGYRQVGSSMSRRSTHMTVAHDMLLTYLRDSGLALSAAQVRKSRSSLYLWLLFLSRPFSRDFFSLAQSILRNDMFIMFRRATLGFVLALARSQLATARAWMNGKTHPSFYETKTPHPPAARKD